MRKEALVTCAYKEHLLDSGVVGASRELPIYEDARGEANLSFEGLIVELMREGRRRYCDGFKGNEGPLPGNVVYKADVRFIRRANTGATTKAT
jgi:hypothetical protein